MRMAFSMAITLHGVFVLWCVGMCAILRAHALVVGLRRGVCLPL